MSPRRGQIASAVSHRGHQFIGWISLQFTFCAYVASVLTSNPFPSMDTALPILVFFRPLVEPSGLRSPFSMRYSTAACAALARAPFFEENDSVREPNGWFGRDGMVHVLAKNDPKL